MRLSSPGRIWEAAPGPSAPSVLPPWIRRLTALALAGLVAACSSGGGSGGSAAAGAAEMAVTPDFAFVSQGFVGGPFTPSSMDYTVTNTGTSAMDWAVSSPESWVTLSSNRGLLQPGDSETITVSFDQAGAATLKAGLYPGSIDFFNLTNGSGDTSRGILVDIEAPAEMVVTPRGAFVSQGFVGGPFTPPSMDYTVTNNGTSAMDWFVFSQEYWVTFSSSGGQLQPGDSETVTVSFDQAGAAMLKAGLYPGSIDFYNLTNGSGDTSRGILVDIQAPAGLVVLPGGDFVSSGPQGGPFAPASKTYVLLNTGSAPLDWTAGTNRGWIQVAPASGQLQPAGQTQVTITIDQNLAAQLGFGSHTGAIGILNQTNGKGSTLRFVALNALAPSGTTAVRALSQFGITWTFDRDYDVGQFANGDWFVLGPVTIESIDPLSTEVGTRTMNGSMTNPLPIQSYQGYDSEMYGGYLPGSYEPQTNVALDVSPSNPLVLQPDTSLVSTISVTAAGARPQLENAAVLTVLSVAPAPGSFRPAYTGTDKRIRWNESQLQYSLLQKLPPVAGTPPMEDVVRWFARPWIDHIPDWIGRYTHPSQNMPDYGREMSDQVGTAALMLHLDYTDAQKRELLVRFVQLGIDFWGIVEAGGENNWPAGGGHHSGRKWPILFAGLMLGDPDMAAIGSLPVAFNEDDQTFYVQETPPGSGVYNQGFGGYGPQHVGMPEWGNQHAKNLGQDDVRWLNGNPYRLCCTANAWWGSILAARMMGAQGLWNHDALFDYQDRYLSENEALGILDWRLAWSRFPLDMWRAYRSSF